MRPISEMATVQIEICSACVKRCSNCTRFSGTKQKETFIGEAEFKAAIDSLIGYSELPHAVIGFMGGEPLLHPQFAEFCKYAASRIPREKLGLWSTFPDAPKYKAYAQLICDTFGVILLNDHSRDDILHAPVLMASEDYFKKPCPTCGGTGKNVAAENIADLWKIEERSGPGWPKCHVCHGTGQVTDDRELFAAVEHCWIQESWSASINTKGAWFCEVAAALSDLFNGPEGWKVEPGWWKRVPKDFTAQMEWACKKCGAALPLERVRNSQDTRDDVSVSNLERLKAIKSRKVARGEVALREEFVFDRKLIEGGTYPHQSYKDEQYRQGIAARYGIRLVLNERGYWDPRMMQPGDELPPPPKRGLFNILQERYS